MQNSFMEPVVEPCFYFQIETTVGTEIVQEYLACTITIGVVENRVYAAGEDDTDAAIFADLAEQLRDYVEGEITEIILKQGWLARMSAPGYLDCTPWSAHASEEEAVAYLEEMYGDEF